MDIGTIELSTILSIAGAISTLAGAWVAVHRIQKSRKRERNLEIAKILQEAKEHSKAIEKDLLSQREMILAELDVKISNVQKDVTNLKDNVDKDLQHLRETYNGEIRNLGQKIEDLRSEIRNQHTQMVGLLTKMIDNRD